MIVRTGPGGRKRGARLDWAFDRDRFQGEAESGQGLSDWARLRRQGGFPARGPRLELLPGLPFGRATGARDGTGGHGVFHGRRRIHLLRVGRPLGRLSGNPARLRCSRKDRAIGVSEFPLDFLVGIRTTGMLELGDTAAGNLVPGRERLVRVGLQGATAMQRP